MTDHLHDFAAQQEGLVTTAQALGAGMTPDAVRHRVASGRWRRVHRGVYQTEPGRVSWRARAVAGLLVAGPGAVLSHESAAYLWGLVRQAPEIVTVRVPFPREVTGHQGLRAVRSRRLAEPANDLADDRHWPWRTTVPETVLDVADEVPLDRAIALVAYAVQRETTTARALRQALGRRRGHRWGDALREVFGDVGDGAQSVAEVRYIRDVERAHGLPAGERQMRSPAGGNRFHDNGYPALRLIVEVDGRLGHNRWDQRVGDGRRDRDAAGEDWLVVRVHWVDVAITPCRTAVDLGQVAARRGWTGRLRPCRRPDCNIPRLG